MSSKMEDQTALPFFDLLKCRLLKVPTTSVDMEPVTGDIFMNLLQKYYRMRQVPYFFKIFINCAMEKKSQDDFILTSKDYVCLENIFMDVTYTRSMEIVSMIFEKLDELISEALEIDLKVAVEFCMILRSIIFSCPNIVQNEAIAEKLITDVYDRLKKMKRVDSGVYRDLVRDILAEIVVKIYLILSTYGDVNVDVDLDTIKSVLPKKPIGLPWKLLLKPAEETSKLGKLITRYIDETVHHECGRPDDELSARCLPNYCVVLEFWRKFFSSFGLFRNYIDGGTMKFMMEIIPNQRSFFDNDSVTKKCLDDFLSVFNFGFQELFVDDVMESDSNVASDGEKDNFKVLVKSAINDNNQRELETLFDISNITQQLRTAVIAFEYLETSRKINEKVKEFFIHFSNGLFTSLPRALTSYLGSDIAKALELLTISLDLFSLMIVDKTLNLVKHPIVSMALTCISFVPWECLTLDQKIQFLVAFKAILKFLRIGMKKCKDLMIEMAPNWIGILRRLQSSFFNLLTNSNDDDDFNPLFFSLGRFYSSLEKCKEMEKISVFLIDDLIECLKKRKLDEVHNEALLRGIYRLISISDAFSISMITWLMDDTSKQLFHVIHENYTKNYKYSGQV